MNQWISRRCLTLAATIGLLAGGAMGARADIIPSFSPSISGAGPFTWTYNVIVSTRQKVNPGDYFTIYDFAGFLGTHSEPAGWSFSSANVGVTPGSQNPTDSSSLPNLTWTWKGASAIGDGTVEVNLGDFSADSDREHRDIADYTGRGTSTLSGLPHGNTGPTQVPAAAPEPGTMALLGLGVMPMLRALRRRRAAA